MENPTPVTKKKKKKKKKKLHVQIKQCFKRKKIIYSYKIIYILICQLKDLKCLVHVQIKQCFYCYIYIYSVSLRSLS